MYRVYIGNLDSEVTEDVLCDLLRDRGIPSTGVVLKRGYAFVDCPDSLSFDQTIDQLNGYNLMGSVLQVESSAISRRLRTSCIQLSNFPPDVSRDRIVQLVAAFGPVQRCDIVEDTPDGCTAIVDYETWQHAREAFEQLDDYNFEGSTLKVQYVTEGDVSSPAVQEPVMSSQRLSGVPLRILVPSDFIGAIIGRKGQTIRSITTQSKARIDVHGKENAGLLEKMISIYGQPEACTDACREIVTIMQREAANSNRGDVTLRMLIDDRYCGRIIGREGKTVKKIREETGTRISISNVQEMASIYPDRVVAIRGNVDGMTQAEAAISAKLRECFERDFVSLSRPSGALMTSQITPSAKGYSGLRASPQFGAMVPGAAAGEYGPTPGGGAALGQAAGGYAMTSQNPPMRESCHIGIPNYAVGAIIGAGGANIKRIIRDSNAFVTVEPRREDQNPSDERFVTIKGNSDACWRASYFIYEKMKLEGFAGADGDVRLRTVISIPQAAAGRVVGKGGKNVREIQRSTGAIITLSTVESRNSQPAELEQPGAVSGDVTVEVYGNFIAVQSAHNRIRTMVYKTPLPPAGGQRSGSVI